MSQTHQRRPSNRTSRGLSLALAILMLTVCYVLLKPVATGSVTHASAIGAAQDTPTPTPTPDEVLEQAKREAQIAEELKKKAQADKDRVEAENAKLKAEVQPLGPATVNVPTGSVTTDSAGWVESQMLAQEAARQITNRLTAKLCNGKFMPGGIAEALPGESPTDTVNNLVIYNNNDLGGVELYVTVLGQLAELKTEYQRENPKALANLNATDPRAGAALAVAPAIVAAPAIATGAIKSVAEVINLFRTDTTFQNKTVQISEDMVASHIVDYLSNTSAPGPGVVWRCPQSIKIYYPALFPAKLLKNPAASPLLGLLNDVESLKIASSLLLDATDARIKDITHLSSLLTDRKKKTLEQGAKGATLVKKKKELANCQNADDCKRLRGEVKEIEKDIGGLIEAIAAIDNELAPDGAVINANASKFKTWLEILSDQKMKLQTRITATELLQAKLNTPDPTTKFTALTQLLRAEKLDEILSNSQTFTLRMAVTANGTTKVKKNIFVDAKVRHSAGANVVYQLFNRDGVIAQGADMQCYISYRSSQQVQDLMNTHTSVECKSN